MFYKHTTWQEEGLLHKWDLQESRTVLNPWGIPFELGGRGERIPWPFWNSLWSKSWRSPRLAHWSTGEHQEQAPGPLERFFLSSMVSPGHLDMSAFSYGLCLRVWALPARYSKSGIRKIKQSTSFMFPSQLSGLFSFQYMWQPWGCGGGGAWQGHNLLFFEKGSHWCSLKQLTL